MSEPPFRPGPWNLSAWALSHPALVVYLIVLLLAAGGLSYFHLGRAEDPDFTVKVMVVRTLWPGASVPEVLWQITEPLEKKLQETPRVKDVRSYSKPGESMIFVELWDDTPKNEVPEAWYQVRKRLGDMAHELPQGAIGPFAFDEFGDTLIALYALTGDGFDLAALRRTADRLARAFYRVPDVKKIEIVGVQEEKIYIDIAPERLASLGLSVSVLAEAIARQNRMVPMGFFETAEDRIRLTLPDHLSTSNPEHVSDALNTLKALTFSVGGSSFRLGDLAEIRRGFSEPPNPRMRLNGKDAIGVGVVMARGGDVMQLGAALNAEVARFQANLPVGIDIVQVADQPEVVRSSLDLFMRSFAEAVAIVLLVSFLSLGLRAGMVVAFSIPLVLALTFTLMWMFGIDLQRVSLGALVIALGLLVDDAIIAVEMMVVKMEQGWNRFRSATFAYASTAFPMLTGTLITAAGFMPVGFARSAAGEYTFSIFAVVAIALLASWVVAVVFTPYLGSRLLNPQRLHALARKRHDTHLYETPFYRRFRALVDYCVRYRWRVMLATLVAFLVALATFAFVIQKQFFPASSRPELLVDLWLPTGASQRATEARSREMERLIRAQGEDVQFFLSYVGKGSPRFFLPLNQQLDHDNFAQFVLQPRDIFARERVKKRLDEAFAGLEWSDVEARTLRLENGPPVGYPVQFRILGDDPAVLRAFAARVAKVLQGHAHLYNVNYDWNELAKGIHLEIDHDRARALGVSRAEIAEFLTFLLQGYDTTRLREGDRQVAVVLRGGAPVAGEGNASTRALPLPLERLEEVTLHLADGRNIPLIQLVKPRPEQAEAFIWRRNRLAALTVRADVRDDARGVESRQPATITDDLWPQIQAIAADLPPGYHIEAGGSVEESAKGENSIKAVMPFMLLVVVTLLMIQLQSIGRAVIVLLTAPLGLIGVALGLVLFHAPFGFVTNLGVIALFGMIMRNAVILVDQIEQDEKAGHAPWSAIVEAAVRRFRPVVLTAVTTMLAMLPLTRQILWGPMAVAIMGGLLLATALTLLVLPAMYAAWRRLPPTPDR